MSFGQLREISEIDAVTLDEDPEPSATDGLTPPIDPTDLQSWLAAQRSTTPQPVVEAALWYLADADAIGLARARTTTEHLNPTL